MDRRRTSSPPGAGGAPGRAAAGGAARIERLCAEHGLVMTGQRRSIVRVLSEAQDHPDAEEVYRRASLLDRRICMTTVYRTVRLFEDRGILERRGFGGGRVRYGPARRGRHHHLVDADTGRAVEFRSAEHARLVGEIAAGLGFVLVDHRLALVGRRAAPAAASNGAGRAPSTPLHEREPVPVPKRRAGTRAADSYQRFATLARMRRRLP